MFFDVNSSDARFTGRWSVDENSAVTTAPGSYFELAVSGKFAVLHFDMTYSTPPYQHLWICVDDGAKIEVPLDRVIRIEMKENTRHIITVTYKGSVEIQHRWYLPLVGRIDFRGVETEAISILPRDERKVIEFIGDSITEGVLIDAQYEFEKEGQLNRPNQDDSTATYAYLTAQRLDMIPLIMGYGGTGVTRGGCGGVPKASLSYGYNFDGSEKNTPKPHIIVINYGANDVRNGAQCYIESYREFLSIVRVDNPNAKIVVLSPFCGAYAAELDTLVREFNLQNKDNIAFINSSGWVEAEPLHPTRESHMKLAEYLSERLTELLKEE